MNHLDLQKQSDIDESTLSQFDAKFFKRCSYILYSMFA